MLDGFQFEINIEIRPIQVLWMKQLDLQNGCDLGVLEPRKQLEGQEMLVTMHMEPEAVLRYADHLNCRGAFSKR